MISAISDRPHVLILGAGLGGLCLAQSLRKKGVPFQIFERDRDIHARFQGWAIALHMVLQDLKESVPDDLSPIETTSHLNPLDLPAQFCMYDRGEDRSRFAITGNKDKPLIRANRSRLREWLATNIDVQWGKIVAKIGENKDKVILHFEDGTSAEGDALIGCDGVNSLVREYLFPNQKLLQTVPAGLLIGQTTLNKEQYRRQLSLGHSVYVALGPGFRLFCGLNSITPDAAFANYYWMVAWHDPVAAQEPYWTATASKQESYEAALEKTKSLDPKFTEIIRLTKVEQMMTPPIVMRDMAPERIPEGRRVTLIGDAAHPMTPYRGEGGNHALLDALNLARMLAKSNKNTVKINLQEYEDEMLERSAVAVHSSRQAVKDDGSETMRGWGQANQASNSVWSSHQGLQASMTGKNEVEARG